MDDYYFWTDDTDDDQGDDFDDDSDADDRPDTPPPVTADAAISDFFLLERARTSGARQRRLDRATDDLRLCFETAVERILITPELAVLELERQFRPEGAAARIADAYALLYVLPLWLDDPHWHGVDLEDRRLRVQLAMPLARYVTRLPSFDGPASGGCVMWDLEYAIERARAGIRLARAVGRAGDGALQADAR